ncbi:type II secretion system protein GspD [Nonlabens agnitus]|uniref:General secretion pathway protein GspD n=1 Tax=Nonlabens agnitus TaxID=870484 RepID=A0A2S9WQX0_9FLAO|nr:general secretion pathway protein GspD [Nonlabens agnitus]PRP65884.1 general secretion pathway protein GspD [Nonlabens agnitus]
MKERFFLVILFISAFGYSQVENIDRINAIEQKLIALSSEVPGLNEKVKTDFAVRNVSLDNFLLAVAEINNININVSQELSNLFIINNFNDVNALDLIVFLSKEYSLDIDITGNILSISKYQPPQAVIEERIIPVKYEPLDNTISVDAQNDELYKVFKTITEVSGRNLVFEPALQNKKITVFINNTPFENAMKQIAIANNLFVEKSEDGFYLFRNITSNGNPESNNIAYEGRNYSTTSNKSFEVLDPVRKIIKVDLVDANVERVILQLTEALNLDTFIASPLSEAGTVTFSRKSISFDDFLVKIFEQKIVSSQNSVNNSNNPQAENSELFYTFKKENNVYYFGFNNQLSTREVAVVQMQHRSIELLSDPSGGNTNSFNRNNSFSNAFGNNPSNNFSNTAQNRNQNNRSAINSNIGETFGEYANKAEAIISILPDEVKKGLDIKVDYELNSFYVNGTSSKINVFKEFISKIDKPVPVVLIEVMILEVNQSSIVETGVSWGINDAPTTTQGRIFPETDLNIGASTLNRVIGGFDGFGSFNLGKVIPNFFVTIKAMESNGNLKIRSTPKLSTLNGHRATFSNGNTSYYTITEQAIIGADNPVTQTVVNFVPIDAELGITIKPLVSGDGQVTLDISVIQSTFGTRISQNAPPDISSREFSSIIRVKDQDIVILGGLEEQSSNNSGSGVPFLARIPVIKWLFSQRVREGRKAKLTVLIKPTIIK